MACSCFQLLALLLAVLAAATLGLGVAHFIATYFLVFVPYCKNVLANCDYAEASIYAFIWPGVWGSLAAFVTAILAIKTVTNVERWRSVFTTTAFITAVILLPAMITLSVVNAIKVTMSPNGSTAPLFNVVTSFPSSATVLFALPLTIAVTGFIEFLLTAGLLVYACVYLRAKLAQVPEVEEQIPIPVPVPVPRPAFRGFNPIFSGPTASYSPYGPPAYSGPTASYSPYGQLPYRRPSPIYSDPSKDPGYLYRPYSDTSKDPGYLYRPAMRALVPRGYPSAAGFARPYPLPYPPTGY